MTIPRRRWLTLVGASVTAAIAGCSGDEDLFPFGESDGMTDTPVSEIVLSKEELPDEFELQDRTPRTESDIDDSGLELGWKEGYQVEFVTTGGSDAVIHTVSRYPPENISEVLEQDILDQELNDDTILEPLPDPEIGTQSDAHRLEFNVRNAVGYFIQTTQADIYQSLLLVSEGGADYELAEELARSATANVE